MANIDTTISNIEEIVSKALEEAITIDEKSGKKILDEEKLKDLSPELRYAVIAEKRRRDTQAYSTKLSQELKLTKAEAETLKELVTQHIAQLPKEEQERLEELKYSDPDKWRVELDVIQNKLKNEAIEKTNRLLEEAKNKALKEYTQEQLDRTLKEFNKLHPNQPITQEQLEYDIPIRLRNRMLNGEISFSEALKEAHRFIYGEKVVKQEEAPNIPSLNKIGANRGVKQTQEKQDNLFF